VKRGDFLLLVDTKGAFFSVQNIHHALEVGGPYFHGHNIYALAYDGTARAATGIWFHAKLLGHHPPLQRRFGKSWTNPPELPSAFPPDTACR